MFATLPFTNFDLQSQSGPVVLITTIRNPPPDGTEARKARPRLPSTTTTRTIGTRPGR